MKNQKMYSAFISSVYESLKEERGRVIDTLLDCGVFPICMEHFIVPTNMVWDKIKKWLDETDVFILMLGSQYGSVDKNGVSWTEREYNYAKKNKKPILAINLNEANLNKDFETLSPDEQKQVVFCKKVKSAISFSQGKSLENIVEKFFIDKKNYFECAGWIRGESEKTASQRFIEWENSHKAFNLAGTWYHVQRSAADENYIRVGRIDIIQEFNPDNYKNLHFIGRNYGINGIDAHSGKIFYDELKRTEWEGKHTIDDHGRITGFVCSQRWYNDDYNGQKMDCSDQKAFHDFHVEVLLNEKTQKFGGTFHDLAPSPKFGNLSIFRNEEDRFKFILENFPFLIK